MRLTLVDDLEEDVLDGTPDEGAQGHELTCGPGNVTCRRSKLVLRACGVSGVVLCSRKSQLSMKWFQHFSSQDDFDCTTPRQRR